MSATTISRPGQLRLDPHAKDAGSATDTPRATADAMPPAAAPEGADSRSDHGLLDAQSLHVAAGQGIQSGHERGDAQTISAGLDHTPGAIKVATSVPGPPQDRADQPATETTAPNRASLADPLLYFLATVVSDIEDQRKANANRLLILTRDTVDKDGEERGFGLTADHPTVAMVAQIVDAFAAQEKLAVRALEKAMKAHQFGPWVKDQRGVGLKTAARLLAAVGDPYWNTLHDRPRTVSELWAYCGLHVIPAGQPSYGNQVGHAGGEQAGDPGRCGSEAQRTSAGVAAKRRKGLRANWSNEAKMRAYLIAECCLKAGGPYADIYRGRRAHTAETHPDWTAGHSHNDALRIVAKEVLKNLWREAKRLHEAEAA